MPQTTEGTPSPVTVRLTAQCGLAFDAKCALKEFERAGDAFRALQWRLEREPEWGVKIPLRDPKNPNADIRMVKLGGTRNVPVIRALYSFDGKEVVIHKLDITRPGYDPIL